MTWSETIILSIVEGITEFLPISSTGHMVIASSILGISNDSFTKLFEIVVQLGAILSVVVLYYKKFFDFSRIEFYLKLILSAAPVLIVGLLMAKKIDKWLESPTTVGITLLVGGIVLLFVDSLFSKPKIDHERNLSYVKGLGVGLWQILALIPGTSRSAATIVGGMSQKLTRRFAAEFSFFLGVPTMFAATGYKLLEAYKHDKVRPAAESLFTHHNIMLLLAGNVIAFIVAMIAIKTFIHYVQRHTLRAFGVYRIIAAAAIFLLMFQGVIKKEQKPQTPEGASTAQVSVVVSGKQ